MSIEKLDKVRIYFDVLRVLVEESKNKRLSLTMVARLANLQFDRFQKCLNQLIHLGFVGYAGDKNIFVAEKGLEYINEYMKFNNFLKINGSFALISRVNCTRDRTIPFEKLVYRYVLCLSR